jgi:flagellar hook capping protein FlgD
MYKTICVLLLLLFLGFSSISSAAPLTIFEKTYIAGKGKPIPQIEEFLATPGEGKIILINGDGQGQNKVNSVSLILNGNQVLGKRDFSRKTDQLEKPILLDSSNSISVAPKGKSGSRITIRVTQEDPNHLTVPIGPGGGLVKVTNPISDLYGVSVFIPEGAFTKTETISISIAENLPDVELPPDVEVAGPYIDFECTTNTFNEPLLIVIPFDSEPQENEQRFLFSYNESLREWELVPPLPSPDLKLLIADVYHFSIKVPTILFEETEKAITNFDLSKDAFEYKNNFDTCSGMAAIATDYYNICLDASPWQYTFPAMCTERLRCRWSIDQGHAVSEKVHTVLSFNTGTVPQMLTGAFNRIATALGVAGDDFYLGYNLLLNHIYRNLKAGRVIPLAMMKVGTLKGHAVVATGIEYLGNGQYRIKIYDVNDNNSFHYIHVMDHPLMPGFKHFVYDDFNAFGQLLYPLVDVKQEILAEPSQHRVNYYDYIEANYWGGDDYCTGLERLPYDTFFTLWSKCKDTASHAAALWENPYSGGSYKISALLSVSPGSSTDAVGQGYFIITSKLDSGGDDTTPRYTYLRMGWVSPRPPNPAGFRIGSDFYGRDIVGYYGYMALEVEVFGDKVDVYVGGSYVGSNTLNYGDNYIGILASESSIGLRYLKICPQNSHSPTVSAPTRVIPSEGCLSQNYPNPFNPETWIPYQLEENTNIVISIHDVSGRLVRTLNLGQKSAGFYIDKSKAAYWDGKNEAGEQAASGVYFYTIQAGDFTDTKKMVIAR